MTFAARLLAAFLSAAVLLIVGCGDDEGQSPSDSTPGPEATSTSMPGSPTNGTPAVVATPSPDAAPSPSPEPTAPPAEPIELDPGVESLAENVLLPVLRAKAALELDPIELAEGSDVVPPPCAALVFYLSWQVRSPYPPTDVNVEVHWTRMGGRDLIGEGPSGQASGGCGTFELVNDSDEWVTAEVRYIIGELTD